MSSPQRKVIQKRTKKKQHYARMCRLRHKKPNDLALAQTESIVSPIKFLDETKIHQFSTGVVLGENNGQLDFELSMLNKDYTSNSITVQKGEHKQLCIKLQKNKLYSPVDDPMVLSEWEKRGDPYWTGWVKRIKRFKTVYEEFIKRNKDKFESEKLDDQSVKRYNAYMSQRSGLMQHRPCVEIRKRCDQIDNGYTEITYNNFFINKLNYEFDDFLNITLKQGIARIKYATKSDERVMQNMMDNFDSAFVQPITTNNLELMGMTKYQNLKKVKFDLIISGYFLKNTAELSFIICLNEAETIPRSLLPLSPISEKFIKSQLINDYERKTFLDKFYRKEYLQISEGNSYASALSPARSDQFVTTTQSQSNLEEEVEEEEDHPNNSEEFIKSELKEEDENKNVILHYMPIEQVDVGHTPGEIKTEETNVINVQFFNLFQLVNQPWKLRQVESQLPAIMNLVQENGDNSEPNIKYEE